MDTFLFAANAVAPVLLFTLLGYFLKKIGLCSKDFAKSANKLCFKVFLPVMLFMNLYNGGGLQKDDLGTVAYIIVACAVMFLVGMLVVRLTISDPRQKGVVLQCIFRSNFAIIGLPLAQSLAGDEGARLAAVASVAAIPLFNTLAVVSLTIYRRDKESGKKLGFAAILKGIVTNPLIIGVATALLVLFIESLLAKHSIDFRLSDIKPLYSVLNSLSGVTSPLALISLGALFEFSAVRSLLKPILVGTLSRVVFMPLLVIGAAVLLFPDFSAAHFALLVAFSASPVAVSSTVMASEMDGDATLAGQYVVWTTLLSMLTIFLFVVSLRAIGIF